MYLSVEAGEQFSDDSMISFSAWTLLLADTAKGDLEQAFNDAQLALEKAPTPLDTVWSQSAQAWAWSRCGEPNKAIEILSQIVPMQRAAPWISSEWFAFFLGHGMSGITFQTNSTRFVISSCS